MDKLMIVKKTVKAIRKSNKEIPSKVYNIQVQDNHNYFANGCLLHNCDDPNSARDAVSELDRDARVMWFESVWSTRGNNPKTDCKLVIQQRIHEMDISGSILSKDENNLWTKLILAMEFSPSRRSKTIILPSTGGKIWEDPRKSENELLWPDRIGIEELEKIKAGLGNAYRISGQLNQNPSPESGGIIKKAWFKWWKYADPPPILHTIMSIDTALDSDVNAENAYSAVTTWGLFEDDHKVMNLILLALWRGKLEYPDLRKFIQRLANNYLDDKFNDPKPISDRNSPDVILIEDKATGMALVRDLHRAGVLATRFNPNKYGDKITRVRLTTHLIENGRVWLPAKPPSYKQLRTYSEEMLEAAGSFPVQDSRDLVDTMTMCLLRLQSSGYLQNAMDDLFNQTSKSSYNGRANKRPYY